MGFYDLGPQIPPDSRRKPTGMLEEDWPVWDAYRNATLGIYKHFYFNVYLTLRDFEALFGMSKEDIRAYAKPYAKKIDVVAVTTEDKIELIEVTAHNSVRSIGQALTYLYLWNTLKPLPGPVQTCILTSILDMDLYLVAQQHKITLYSPDGTKWSKNKIG